VSALAKPISMALPLSFVKAGSFYDLYGHAPERLEN
jgi:hypothetical protein